MPADLRDAPSGPDFDALPFTSLYLLEDEWAAEIANRTMHGVMHIGRVRDETGGFRAHMAVYVKPNGLLGSAYMAAIRPFRHLIVYPLMLRDMGRTWRASTAGHPEARRHDVTLPPATETVLKPGDAFHEPTRSVHLPSGSARSSRSESLSSDSPKRERSS